MTPEVPNAPAPVSSKPVHGVGVLPIAVLGAALYADVDRRVFPGAGYWPERLTVRWSRGRITGTQVFVDFTASAALRPGLPLIVWGGGLAP